jgi:hypothetical protein
VSGRGHQGPQEGLTSDKLDVRGAEAVRRAKDDDEWGRRRTAYIGTYGCAVCAGMLFTPPRFEILLMREVLARESAVRDGVDNLMKGCVIECLANATRIGGTHGIVRETLLVMLDSVLHGQTAIKHDVNGGNLAGYRRRMGGQRIRPVSGQ